MIIVLQRVIKAEVSIDGNTVGKCGYGLLLLVGVTDTDTEYDADVTAVKISKLRIFEDENGKMNLSVNDIGGSVLSVSNFTLLANYRHGNRPDFLRAGNPEKAKHLYEYFNSRLRENISQVETGVFGADMKIELINDGPVTLVIDSEVLKK